MGLTAKDAKNAKKGQRKEGQRRVKKVFFLSFLIFFLSSALFALSAVHISFSFSFLY